MVKLPDAQQFIGRETPQWRAFSPSYRLPNMDPGYGEALRQVGQDMSSLGQYIKQKQDVLQSAQAETDFSINNDNLYFERSQDPDYQNAPGRFWQESQQNIQGAAEKITDPERRQLFIAQATRAAHVKSMQLQRFSMGRYQQDTTAQNDDRLDNLAKQALLNPDPDYRGQKLQEARKIIDSEYWLSPKERELRWNKYRHTYAGAYVMEEIRRNPDAALQQLNKIAPPQQPADKALGPQSSNPISDSYAKTTFRIESGGNPNAVTGSNRGLGQFGPAEEAKFGINDANRTDPRAQARALQLEADQNRPKLAAVLGRQPTDAELYIAHQQGVAGGPALLANPQQVAWQAIRPFYKSDAIARQAIYGNIPNDSPLKHIPVDQITAGQFTDLWKAKYAHFAGEPAPMAYAEPTQGTPTVDNPLAGQQFAQADTGVQTDAGPQVAPQTDGTHDFNHNSPDGSPVPPERRTGTPYDFLTADQVVQLRQHALQEQRARLLDTERIQRIQKQQFQEQSDKREIEILQDLNSGNPSLSARDILADPKLDRAAKERLMKAAGTENKDVKTYGTGFYDLFKRIHASENDPNKLNDVNELYKHVGPGGDITLAGLEKLRQEMTSGKNPDVAAENELRKQFLKTAHSEISGQNDLLHMRDPKGEELYLKFMARFYKEYEKGRADNKSPEELLSPDGPLFKSIQQFKRKPEQFYSDMSAANSGDQGGTFNTVQDLLSAVHSGRISRDAAAQIAIQKGWARPNPQPADQQTVPLSR